MFDKCLDCYDRYGKRPFGSWPEYQEQCPLWESIVNTVNHEADISMNLDFKQKDINWTRKH